MKPFDLVLRGGFIADGDRSTRASVYVTGERIAAITDPAVDLPALRSVDVAGQYVLPGLIDSHTHFRTFSGHSDEFEDVARAAAHGGLTTIIAFVMGMNATEKGMRERYEHFRAQADGHSPVDFAFHAGLAPEPGALEDLAYLHARGVRSFKMFMAYRARGLMADDGFMFKAMRLLAQLGGLAMVHAEAGDAIDALSGAVTGDSPDAYLRTRPAWTEAEAVERAISLASEAACPLYVVHISTAEALQLVVAAKRRGQAVYAETCPHYLVLTSADVSRLGPIAKVAPPIREAADRDALIRGVLSGDIDVVGSDHAPYTRATKEAGTFMDAPVGAPGTETLVGITWKAISDNGGSVSDLVRVLAERPAAIFGLAPDKGRIAVGAYADFSIVDTGSPTTIRSAAQHSHAGYSLFDGWDVPLAVVATYVRGRAVLEGGRVSTHCTGKIHSPAPS